MSKTEIEDERLLRERVNLLQDNVTSLRLSRRVLMNLIEQLKNEHEQERRKINKEKQDLKKENAYYAKALWEKNKRICELESNNLENNNINKAPAFSSLSEKEQETLS